MAIVGPDSPQRTPLVCTGREGPYVGEVPAGADPERYRNTLERLARGELQRTEVAIPIQDCPQCAACPDPIVPGQWFTRVPLGPGKDPEKRRLMRAGLPFEVVFALLHWPCASGDEGTGRLVVVP